MGETIICDGCGSNRHKVVDGQESLEVRCYPCGDVLKRVYK